MISSRWRSGAAVVLTLWVLGLLIGCAEDDYGIDAGEPASCSDQELNGLEADVDCGGKDCSKCGNGAACLRASDCSVGSCVERTCQAEHCTDGEVGADESDRDCGGEECSACPPEALCNRDDDCASGGCVDGRCAPVSCDDGEVNGEETDEDCGGPCVPCLVGAACDVDDDCASAVCQRGSCQAASCGDQRQNGGESDVDCGGDCPGCGLRQACADESDCTEGDCLDERCQAEHCANGELDADETAADCGGTDCVGCASGAECNEDDDCLDAACAAGVCRAPECFDGKTNGSETSEDCGGRCPPCAAAAGCSEDADCESRLCKSGLCRAAHCDNRELDEDESDVDCGGDDCEACVLAAGCRADTDCAAGICTDGSCRGADCSNLELDGDESDVDCGGSCNGCEPFAACTVGEDCASGFCEQGLCLSRACGNSELDGEETGVDCGGPDCLDCPAGEGCSSGGDCASRSCSEAGVCLAATCDDFVRNGSEGDVDCGGSCEPCEAGDSCNVAGDCESAVCRSGVCLQASCDDAVFNGEEADEDCGGPCASACANGQTCATNTDCESEYCLAGRCATLDCTDEELNGDETDVDCGGTVCSPCLPTFSCEIASDCTSKLCTDGICGSPACSDDVLNGAETAVDCGGPNCSPCPPGSPCRSARDCNEGVCLANTGVCAQPTCSDGVANGAETGEDCGGPSCSLRCPAGNGCQQPGDCASGVCDAGACQAPICRDDTHLQGDEVRNGSETAVDCGGPVCAPCEAGATCALDRDCATPDFFCQTGTFEDEPDLGQCVAAECDDGELNGLETSSDCGGPDCAPCATGRACLIERDCQSLNCEDICIEATCDDGIRNQGEGGVDCGGAPVVCPDGPLAGLCADGEACTDHVDCESRVCTSGECQAALCDVSGTGGDGVRNGTETDVDCGGSGCDACAPGARCALGSDCSSLNCAVAAEETEGECQPATCDDGVQNQGEGAVDCGNVDVGQVGGCELCADDSPCDPTDASDCASGVCKPSSAGEAPTCQVPSCGDGVRNGAETDVDCGVIDDCTDCSAFATCDACGPRERCDSDDDCGGSVPSCSATSKTCVFLGCEDELQSGSETDVDCGGTDCSPCQDGQLCEVSTDCSSQVCTGTCQEPSCRDTTHAEGDGVVNGDESGVDCGGVGCDPCPAGEACRGEQDCESLVCTSNQCQQDLCDDGAVAGDGVLNGLESAVDCGGPIDTANACNRCAAGDACGDALDCRTGLCDATAGTCTASPLEVYYHSEEPPDDQNVRVHLRLTALEESLIAADYRLRYYFATNELDGSGVSIAEITPVASATDCSVTLEHVADYQTYAEVTISGAPLASGASHECKFRLVEATSAPTSVNGDFSYGAQTAYGDEPWVWVPAYSALGSEEPVFGVAP